METSLIQSQMMKMEEFSRVLLAYVMNVAKENFDIKKPLRVSINNNAKFDQAVACSADGKEVIAVGTVMNMHSK